MTEIIYWIISMSILGTFTCTAVLLIGCIKKIPRRAVMVLWALPAIRLLFPVSLGSKISWLNIFGKYAPRIVEIPDSGLSELVFSEFTMMNAVQLADEYFPARFENSGVEGFFDVTGIIYVIVAAALLLTAVTLAVMSRAELRNARHLKDNIYISENLLSPAAVGILRPRIILPEYLADGDNEYVLMHERAHIVRHDNLYRALAVFICCLHWFNPFIWLFLGRFLETLELACDENVLARCGEEKKKEYAKAIIGCEEKRTVFISSFGGARTRVRIEKILSYKKMSLLSAVCLALFILAAAVVLLTNSV